MQCLSACNIVVSCLRYCGQLLYQAKGHSHLASRKELWLVMQALSLQHCSVINCSSTRVETSFHRSRRTVHWRCTSARGITRQGKVRRSRICSASAGTTADFAKQFEELSNACEYLKSMPPSEVRSECRAWLAFVAAGGAFAGSCLILLRCVSAITAIK